MNPFRNAFIIIPIIIILITGVVMAIPQHQTLKESVFTSPSEQAGETAAEENSSAAVMIVAEVTNPFEQNENISVSFSAEGDSSNIASIASKTHYDVDYSELTLPTASEFNTIGAEHANMGDSGTIIISHEYTFLTDCLVVWNQGSSIDTTNSWESHPNTISMVRGQTIVVTYTSQDGGSSWVGKITQ